MLIDSNDGNRIKIRFMSYKSNSTIKPKLDIEIEIEIERERKMERERERERDDVVESKEKRDKIRKG